LTGVGDGNCVHRVLVPCNPLWPDAVPCGQKRLKELHTAVTENRQELKQEMKDRYDRKIKHKTKVLLSDKKFYCNLIE